MKPERRLLLAGLILAVVVFVQGAARHHLLQPDETRVAGIASEMAAGGSLVIPTLNGEPFLEKPPLGYLGVSLCLRAFGRSAFVARLPSLLWALVAAGALGLLARDIYGSNAAALASGLLLLFTPSTYDLTHRCMVDPALLGATALSVLLLRRAARRPQERARWALGAALAVALSFLAKGAIGLAFPGLALLGLIAARRDAELLKSGWLWAAPFLVAALASLWLGAVYLEGGREPLRVIVVENHLHRFLPGAGYQGGHQRPWYFYFDRILTVLLPSLALLPTAIAWHRGRRHTHDALWLLLFWLGGGFVLLSLAGTKRQLYLLPLVPPACLVVGGWIGSLWEPGRVLVPYERWTLRGLVGFVGLAALVGPAAILVRGGATVLLVTVWISGVAFAALSFAALRRGLARRAVLHALCVGLLAWLAVSPPLAAERERQRDLSGFYEEVGRRVPPEMRLLVLCPHESTLGALGFHLGRRCEVVEDVDRALACLRGEEALALVVVEPAREGQEPLYVTRFEGEGGSVFRRASGRELALLVVSEGR